MDSDRSEEPEPRRLAGFDTPAVHRGSDYAWYGEDHGPPPRSSSMGYQRERGIRSSRRASTWTAAALIATVAATTGYLAHAVPVTGASGTSTSAGTGQSGKSTTVTHGGPNVSGPVVTSGGSGVAAGSAGGDN
jgi:hypothetical protein